MLSGTAPRALAAASVAWILAGVVGLWAACDDGPAESPADADAQSDVTADVPAETVDIAREPGLPPEIASILPNAGPQAGGQQVTAQGRHFVTPTQVFFDDNAALSVQVVDERSLSVLVPPANATGAVDVRVVTRDGEAVLERGYTYLVGDEPFVESVEPARGDIAGGETMTVTGINFPTEGLVQVAFGSSAATSVALGSETELTAVTPAHDYGLVPITFNFDGRVQILDDAFLFWADLAVDSIAPEEGSSAGGTDVILFGAGMVDGAGIEVHFGDALADPADYLFEGDSMAVVTPAGQAGAVDVVVEGENGRVVLPDGFSYLP